MNSYSSELNVTPLIDVLLVLVVMFVITVPIATHAVKLDLPVGKSAVAIRPTIELEIDFDGRVFWNGTGARDDSELERWLVRTSHSSPQPVIRIRPEKRTRYERVAQVLAETQRARVTHVALVPVSD